MPQAMQKRRSFELQSRRAKSSEEVANRNKKTITDLFFERLPNDKQHNKAQNGPKECRLAPAEKKANRGGNAEASSDQDGLPQKLRRGRSSTLLRESKSFVMPSKRPKILIDGCISDEFDMQDDEDMSSPHRLQNNSSAGADVSSSQKFIRKRDRKGKEKTKDSNDSGGSSSNKKNSAASRLGRNEDFNKVASESTAKFASPNATASRYRKNQAEMDVLYREFKKNKGKMPPRKQRLVLAQELNLKENQVYKWFWELKQKQEELEEVPPVTRDISEFSLLEKFDVFVNKELKQYRDQIRLRGNELGGRRLSDEEMTTAIKLYLQSVKVDECEYVASQIGFDIADATE